LVAGEHGPLVRSWVARLADVIEDRRTEPGFWFVSTYLGQPETIPRFRRVLTYPAGSDANIGN
jgi:hypothetical protein